MALRRNQRRLRPSLPLPSEYIAFYVQRYVSLTNDCRKKKGDVFGDFYVEVTPVKKSGKFTPSRSKGKSVAQESEDDTTPKKTMRKTPFPQQAGTPGKRRAAPASSEEEKTESE